jgi:hypothetical protein
MVAKLANFRFSGPIWDYQHHAAVTPHDTEARQDEKRLRKALLAI